MEKNKWKYINLTCSLSLQIDIDDLKHTNMKFLQHGHISLPVLSKAISFLDVINCF